jgi:dephospho-CoA kinase
VLPPPESTQDGEALTSPPAAKLRRGQMTAIGLTGGIGSGKSTVSTMLAAKGARVVDADAITRELQQPGTAVFDAMVERFGPGIVRPDGALDRPAVADIVFNDAAALADLNAIVHPAVGAEISQRMTDLGDSDEIVVLDVPLMVESMGKRSAGRRRQNGAAGGGRAGESKNAYPAAGLLVVDVDPEIAVTRLVTQRGMREADVRARMARQASREERVARADFVVHNDGSLDDLAPQVDAAWEWIGSLRN